MDITAGDLILTAGTAIGESSNHIETKAVNLSAKSTSGSTFVTESDSITVTNLSLTVERVGTDGGTTTTTADTQEDLLSGGDLVLATTNGFIKVNGGTATAAAGISAAEDILLSAGETDVTDAINTDITLNASVTSTGGNISVIGKDGITQSVNGDITANGADKTIDLKADAGISMVDGALTQTNNGNIRYEATTGDITIGEIDAGTAKAALIATAGSILDGGDAYTDVTADGLRLVAGVGTVYDPLDTAVNTVAASAGSGGIYLSDADSVVIGTVGPVVIDRVLADGTTVTVTDDPISGLTATDGGSVVQVVLDGTIIVNEPITTTDTGSIVLQADDVSVNAPLTSPTDDITVLTSDGASFRWPAVAGATRYYLEILRNGSVFDAVWVDGTSWVTGYTFSQGTYTWTVRPWSPDGFGPLSAPATFVIQARPEALTPTGTVPGAGLSFTWTTISGATRYQLLIYKDGGDVPIRSEMIDGMTIWTSDQDFVPGTYQWTVQPWSPDGFGLKSNPAGFVIAETGGAGVPTAITPSGTLADPTGVTFTWTLLPNVRWYRVILEKDGEIFAVQWLDSVDSWTPGVPIVEGTYRWTVQAWSLAGYGLRSNSVAFNYGVPLPSSAPGAAAAASGTPVPAGLLSAAMMTSGEPERLSTSADADVDQELAQNRAVSAVDDPSSVIVSTFAPETNVVYLGGFVEPTVLEETDAGTNNSGMQLSEKYDGIAGVEETADYAVSIVPEDGPLLLESIAAKLPQHVTDNQTATADNQSAGDGSLVLIQTGETDMDLVSARMGYIAPIDVIVGPMNDFSLKQDTSTDRRLEEKPDGI